MKWNADFEIAGIIVVFVFIMFFFAKKHLPTRKNRFFAFSMILAALTTVFDLVSAYVDSNWMDYPLPVLHVINIIFFMLSTALTLSFMIYILMLAGRYDLVHSPVFYLYTIPFMITMFLTLSTPFTGNLYYFDPVEGYVHGPAYFLNFMASSVYLVLTGIYVIIYRKRMTKLQFRSVVTFIVLILTGILLQSRVFNWILLSYPSVCLAVMIIYLSLQNPDMYIDKMTELFNADGFYEIMAEYANAGRHFNVLVVTIDNFRTMQSVYGTDRVNEALKKATAFFDDIIGTDILFRISEDSFAAVDINGLDYGKLGEKVLDRFKEPWRVNGGEVSFTVYATCLPYEHIKDNVKGVSRILSFIHNKLAHDNGNILLNEDIMIAIDRDSAVERALEKAIDNNTVQIYLQPIFNPKAGKALMAEVLARLFDEEVGFIAPAEFVTKAEENGNIVELGKQIFEKVCMFVRDNDTESFGIKRVTVNLSAFQCIRESMADEMLDIASKYNVPMSTFAFEIVEGSADIENGFIRRNMDRLIEAGAEFMLDDYGIGYSNFVNLLKLPFKYVKMDRTLVWTYFENSSNVLPDVMETFKNQNLKIVVQGVESKAMAKRLVMMGCDMIQGYFFSKAVPARDFVRLMNEKNIEGGFGI